jgi:Sulfotransferase domain
VAQPCSYFKKTFGKYSRFAFTEKDYRAHCARYWNACIVEIDQRKKDLALEAKGQFLEFSYEYLCQNPREVVQSVANFIGVTSDGFGFDISEITNRNYKVADYASNPERVELLNIMSPGMTLKDYMPDRPSLVE